MWKKKKARRERIHQMMFWDIKYIQSCSMNPDSSSTKLVLESFNSTVTHLLTYLNECFFHNRGDYQHLKSWATIQIYEHRPSIVILMSIIIIPTDTIWVLRPEQYIISVR